MRTVLMWIRTHLFATWLNGAMTILLIWAICRYLPEAFRWSVLDANFVGDSPEACTGRGACWVFIRMRLNQFLYGFYPRDLEWRIDLSYILILLAIVVMLIVAPRYRMRAIVISVVLLPVVCFVLYYGGVFGLEKVATYSWGGLHLTLVIACTGMLCSLPIGILLALGRRSSLPIVRSLCIGFIELWRGVPLISVLFMASVLLPICFPSEVQIDKLLRALMGIVLFASAYMAEVIRGGLQMIPAGQYDAARALGCGYYVMMSRVILPQTLKIAVPGIINIFMALLKDTTLVLIIGLFDLLAMVQAAMSDPQWLAYGLEGYIFAAVMFWIFSIMISRFGVFLERKL